MLEAEDVMNFIKDSGRVSVTDIATAFAVPVQKAAPQMLSELCNEDKIQKIATNRGVYYLCSSGITVYQLEHLDNELNKNMYQIEDAMMDVKDEISDVKSHMGKIYADFISLMAIFVAVYAFVSINANVIAGVADKEADAVGRTVILVNISVCICLAVFVVLVRWLVLRPLQKN